MLISNTAPPTIPNFERWLSAQNQNSFHLHNFEMFGPLGVQYFTAVMIAALPRIEPGTRFSATAQLRPDSIF